MANLDNNKNTDSMSLSPNIARIRDALVEKFKGLSLSEVSGIVKKILQNEKNEVNRLAALAARVEIVRLHINKIRTESGLKPKEKILRESTPSSTKTNTNTVEVEDNDTNDKSDWVRVKMLETGVVRGVRFPEGIVIDVNPEDADRLIQSKKAEISDKNENKDYENNADNKEIDENKAETSTEKSAEIANIDGQEESNTKKEENIDGANTISKDSNELVEKNTEQSPVTENVDVKGETQEAAKEQTTTDGNDKTKVAKETDAKLNTIQKKTLQEALNTGEKETDSKKNDEANVKEIKGNDNNPEKVSPADSDENNKMDAEVLKFGPDGKDNDSEKK